MAPAEDEGRGQALEVVRTALGDRRHGDAYAEGAAMTPDEALTYALSSA